MQEERDFSHEMFRYAKAFAEADEILIAAPFWDLAFPAILRNYIEKYLRAGAGVLLYGRRLSGQVFAGQRSLSTS